MFLTYLFAVLYHQGGYRGFYSKNTLKLTPKVVNNVHKHGGTFLRTSRGGHDTNKIVDNIQDRGINQVQAKRLDVYLFQRRSERKKKKKKRKEQVEEI